MYFFIKTILICQSKDKGFAVPFAIILGLIMILLATVNIVKSNEENLTAIGQRKTATALTAAEAGVAYYQNLINKNRVIAVYNGTGTTSWTNNSSIPDIDFYTTAPANCSSSGFSTANGFGSAAVTSATTGWKDVPGGNGQYRLESYNYSSANDTGTLVVRGRDINTDQDASVAQLEVQFDVQPGVSQGAVAAPKMTENLNGFDPALWLGNQTTFSVTNTGKDNFEVEGNIIISANNCQLSSGKQTLANALGNATADPRSLLATPTPPDDATPGYPFDETKINVINASDINKIISTAGTTKTLPGSDKSILVNGGKDQIAYYLIKGDLTLASGESIEVSNGAKVILFVQGDISFTGNVELNQNATNTSDRLEIYGNISDGAGGYTLGCDPNGSFTCPNTTDQITFAGSDTINIKAFIHAPDAVVSVTGDADVNIDGAIWVKGWSDPSGTSKKITITPDDRYKDYTSIGIANGSSNLTVKPIIYPPKSWKTQEAN